VEGTAERGLGRREGNSERKVGKGLVKIKGREGGMAVQDG